MSEDEKGFLARWSQRKREASKAEPDQVSPDASVQPAQSSPEPVAGEAEPPIDLESLPKLEDLTVDTDMTVFFKKGVPESIRNAALRKSWALDPAIRNYVNPALDYAYDWNTPGGVPGSGELAPGTDIARMVLQVMGSGESSQPPVDKRESADDASSHVAEQTQTPDAPSVPVQSVRLSDVPSSAAEPCADTAGADSAAVRSSGEEDEPRDERRAFASQQDARRHGTARPK